MAEKVKAEDSMECPSCGREIPWDEYCQNFGMCSKCFDKDLDRYFKEKEESNGDR